MSGYWNRFANTIGEGFNPDIYGHIDEEIINHLEPLFNEYEDCMELHRDEEDIGSCMECLKEKIYKLVGSKKERLEAKEFIKAHPEKASDGRFKYFIKLGRGWPL